MFDNFFVATDTSDTHLTLHNVLQRQDDLELFTFPYTEQHQQEKQNDMDSDNNIFFSSSCYYMDDQLISTVRTEDTFSIIHFNSRSLYTNFHKIKHCLSQVLHPFNKAKWDRYGLGLATYEIISKSRENTTECDVAVFINSNFIYKVVEEM